MDRDGLRASYRKIHLYDSFGYQESARLVAGPVEPVLVDVDGFRVGLMTCYDLRFPELARELVSRGAELLVVPAAWVAGPLKVDHWRTLARARAIENTVFVAAVGQPGPRYTGHSMVVGPAGEVVAELPTVTASWPPSSTAPPSRRPAPPTRRWPTGASRAPRRAGLAGSARCYPADVGRRGPARPDGTP